ncbi:MAG: signal recognition particle-docking protein FtsY [Treponema sp.]|jgi:fused signal recognition particle receptor|nr:signal recognition particle-docking protein FtsY [Treponema sp.]
MKFGERIKNFFSGRPALCEELYDDLCDLLVEGDFGVAEAYKTVELLKERCKKENPETVPEKLAELLEEELRKAAVPMGLEPATVSAPSAISCELPCGEGSPQQDKLTAILLLGVNGVGKTTAAAKISFLYSEKYKKKTILAAADTFRAAAIDQLKIHGQRLNTRIIAHKQGADPAAVVYDALEAALSGGIDVVIADTAGRMHTKSALVEELRKIDRVVESKARGVRYLKYLVLDATTGKNAYTQAEIFHDAVTIDGVILTKYDSTAKGGVVFSLASGLHLPVVYVCFGEKYGDMEMFDPHKFAREFAGIE